MSNFNENESENEFNFDMDSESGSEFHFSSHTDGSESKDLTRESFSSHSYDRDFTFDENEGVLIPENQDRFSAEAEKRPEEKRGGRYGMKKFIAACCIISILGGSFLGIGIGVSIPITERFLAQKETGTVQGTLSGRSGTVAPEAPNTINTNSVSELNGDYLGALEKALPSVVNITAMVQSGQNFFGQTQEYESGGTGIMFEEHDEKIFVVTNYHVVSGAKTVDVYIDDKGPFNSLLVGRDSEKDIAVISINKVDVAKAGINDVQLAKFGDSSDMKIGALVLAISNAPGEGLVVTDGIISTGLKEIEISNKTYEVLQTTAAINPGSSGGPLVNMSGEVIGINTAKLLQGGTMTSYGTVEGVGYSIPSNAVKQVIDLIMNQKGRPMLGIRGYDATGADSGNANVSGVCVYETVLGGAAKAAGILSEDIIISFNGKDNLNMSQLVAEIAKCEVGQTVPVTVLRGDEKIDLNVTLTEDTGSNF